jgi:phosphohistidine phosphatase
VKTILFLRHAKSDWSSSGQSDFDRPLAPRGERAAPQIGQYIKDHGLTPDQVLCSAAVRARQTWDLAAAKLAGPPPVEILQSLYLASPHDVIEVIREHGGGADCLCIVGHHPGVDGTVLMLAGSSDRLALDRVAAKYPTGALAVLQSGIDHWQALAPGIAELTRFVTPRDLASQ